jgi:hypothetical protein
MAVAKHKGKLPRPSNLAEVILKGVELLLTRDNHKNIQDALELIDDSEGGTLKLNMPITVDCTESAPQITIDLGYTKSYRDRRVMQMDDPDQAKFHFVDQSAKQTEAKLDTGDDELDGKKAASGDREDRVVVQMPTESAAPEKKKGRGRPKKK